MKAGTKMHIYWMRGIEDMLQTVIFPYFFLVGMWSQSLKQHVHFGCMTVLIFIIFCLLLRHTVACEQHTKECCQRLILGRVSLTNAWFLWVSPGGHVCLSVKTDLPTLCPLKQHSKVFAQASTLTEQSTDGFQILSWQRRLYLDIQSAVYYWTWLPLCKKTHDFTRGKSHNVLHMWSHVQPCVFGTLHLSWSGFSHVKTCFCSYHITFHVWIKMFTWFHRGMPCKQKCIFRTQTVLLT